MLVAGNNNLIKIISIYFARCLQNVIIKKRGLFCCILLIVKCFNGLFGKVLYKLSTHITSDVNNIEVSRYIFKSFLNEIYFKYFLVATELILV